MCLRLMKREHEFARKIANVNLLDGTQTRIQTRNGKRAFARENAYVPNARENANVHLHDKYVKVPYERENANVPFARLTCERAFVREIAKVPYERENANVPFARSNANVRSQN